MDGVKHDELLSYCLAKPGAWQDEPWEGDVVVKVGSKIFAFLGSEPVSSVGLKCGPTREAADEWLLRYPDDASVMAYIGRSGWNSLRTGGAIPDDELREAVDTSYDAVVSKLPKKEHPAPVPEPRKADARRVYDALVAAWLGEAGVTLGRALQNEVLKVNNKIFAFLSRDRLVVKLPAARAAAMVTAGEAEVFESGGRRLKEWVAVPAVDPDRWQALMADAHGYVGGVPRSG